MFFTLATISWNSLTVSPSFCCRRYSSWFSFFSWTFWCWCRCFYCFIGVCGHAKKTIFRWNHVSMCFSKLEIFLGCDRAERHGWFFIYFHWWLCCATDDSRIKDCKQMRWYLKKTEAHNEIWQNRELVADQTRFNWHHFLTPLKWFPLFPLAKVDQRFETKYPCLKQSRDLKHKNISIGSFIVNKFSVDFLFWSSSPDARLILDQQISVVANSKLVKHSDTLCKHETDVSPLHLIIVY